MTRATPERKQPALFLRPHVFFPALVVLITISVMLTPRVETTEGPQLTTHSVSPTGGRGLASTLRNLGWKVSELDEPLSDKLSTDAVYAVLVSSSALTENETHILLERVRAGASALVLAGGGALADSLHVSSGLSGVLEPGPGDTTSCPAERHTLSEIPTRFPLVVYSVRPNGPVTKDTVHLAALRTIAYRDSLRRRSQPAVMGIPLGKGRIAVVADGRMLMNDVFRVCHWGTAVVAVRTVEWLSARDDGSHKTSVVFDEFHQGYGHHASVVRAIFSWLGTTQSGRTAAQLVIAALILLAASAPRPIAPLPRTSIPRRSPLEHVSALAQAYEQVKATRTAARLLVQGVRRRAAPSTGARRATDEQFLASVASRFPALKSDTDRARHAMLDSVPPAELIEVANTIDRIERSVRP